MAQADKVATDTIASERVRTGNARVQGRWLLPVRGALVALALLALFVFFAGVLLDFGQFRTVCTGTSCVGGQLTAESARALQALHLSIDAYAVINVLVFV